MVDYNSLYQSVRNNRTLHLALICAVIFLLAALLYVKAGVSLSGDEPHFLIISQTLLKYHSLDVMRDYKNGDYYKFYPMPISPHITHNIRGEILPLHSIGGPILWLIPFFFLDRLGAVLFISLLSVFVIINMYKLLLAMGIKEHIAFLVGLAYAIASPLAIYAHLVFIEPIAALICVYVFRVCVAEKLTPFALILCSFGLGVLPWVHIRFVLLEIPLFFALLYRIFTLYKLRHLSYYVSYLLPVILLFIAFELYSYFVWGTLNPAANQIYGGSVPFEVSPVKGIIGMFFDQEYGLLSCFPLFFFMLAGIILTLKKRYLFYHLLVLLLSVPYIIAFTSFRHWSGGWSPPARFILVLLPLYAFYIAVVLDRTSNAFSLGLFRLAVWWGSLYNVLSLLALGNHGYNSENGQNSTLKLLRVGNFNVTTYLPSIYRHGQTMLFLRWGVVYGIVTVLLLALYVFSDAPVRDVPFFNVWPQVRHNFHWSSHFRRREHLSVQEMQHKFSLLARKLSLQLVSRLYN